MFNKFMYSLLVHLWAILASCAGTLDTATFQAALKEYYTNDKVEDLVYKDAPMLAMLAKMEEFGGKNLPIPLIYGNPQGRSADFAKALANQTNTQTKEFVLTRSKDYGIATISNEVIQATRTDKMAFLQAATTEIDGTLNGLARSLAQALYGDGSGTIGAVANASFATTTLTLSDPNTVVNFEQGQTIVVSATSGAAPRTGTLVIAGVDRDAGTLTTTQNLSTGIAAIAQGDFISVQGDTGVKLSGLASWLPAPGISVTSTPFFGVDRTSDRVRLAGVSMDLRGMPIEEQLKTLATRLGREGANPDYCFMNYDNWNSLELSMASRVVYVNITAGTEGQIGFQGIKIQGPKRPIVVVPDMNAPSNLVYMLQSNVVKLYSLGKAPKLFDTDGLDMLRDGTSDALQVRCYYYAQLGIRAPGWCGVALIK